MHRVFDRRKFGGFLGVLAKGVNQKRGFLRSAQDHALLSNRHYFCNDRLSFLIIRRFDRGARLLISIQLLGPTVLSLALRSLTLSLISLMFPFPLVPSRQRVFKAFGIVVRTLERRLGR